MKKTPVVVRHKEDRWIEFVNQDTEEVLFSVQAPKDGFTTDEVESFLKALHKLTEKPS